MPIVTRCDKAGILRLLTMARCNARDLEHVSERSSGVGAPPYNGWEKEFSLLNEERRNQPSRAGGYSCVASPTSSHARRKNTIDAERLN